MRLKLGSRGQYKKLVRRDFWGRLGRLEGREGVEFAALTEGAEGAVLCGDVLRVAAEDEVEEWGLVDRGFEGGGEGGVWVGVVVGVGAGGLCAGVEAVHEGGLDGPPTRDLPAGGSELADEGGFDGGTG